MKKTLLFIASLIMFILAGCTSHADGSSVWGEGLGILPFLTLVGAGIFGYSAYKAHNSGSIEDGVESNQKVPYHEIGQFWFSVALIVATLIIVVKVAFLDR